MTTLREAFDRYVAVATEHGEGGTIDVEALRVNQAAGSTIAAQLSLPAELGPLSVLVRDDLVAHLAKIDRTDGDEDALYQFNAVITGSIYAAFAAGIIWGREHA